MSQGVGAFHASSPPRCLQLPALSTALPAPSLPCQGGGNTTVVGSELDSLLEEVNTTALRSWLAQKPLCAWLCMYESTVLRSGSDFDETCWDSINYM